MSDSKHRNNVPPSRPGSGTPSKSSANTTSAASPRSPSTSTSTGNNEQANKQSGRVAYDSRGNPVWEWQTSTGVFEQDVSTQRLKKLEAPELSFAATQPVPVIGGGKEATKKSRSTEDTGFNPYNSDEPIKPRATQTPAAHPALVHKKPPAPSTLAHKQPPPRRPEPPKPTGMWDKFKSKFS